MSTKKLQKTLDSVKGDVRELAEAFWAFRDEVMTQQAVRAAETQSTSTSPADPHVTDRLSDTTSGLPSAGHVELFGHYEMSDNDGAVRAYRWALEQQPIEGILSPPLDDVAGVLAAIGHKQRLGIVLMLLRRPATANEIVARLSLGTTGAAYHHVNVLQRSGLVQQEQRGVFSISPQHVPSIIAILSGLSGLIRTTIETIAPATGTTVDPDAEDDDNHTPEA